MPKSFIRKRLIDLNFYFSTQSSFYDLVINFLIAPLCPSQYTNFTLRPPLIISSIKLHKWEEAAGLPTFKSSLQMCLLPPAGFSSLEIPPPSGRCSRWSGTKRRLPLAAALTPLGSATSSDSGNPCPGWSPDEGFYQREGKPDKAVYRCLLLEV